MRESVCTSCHTANNKYASICRNCGKPLDEKNAYPDLRYEGAARRSSTKCGRITNRIWRFFSSVKAGMVLLLLTLIASAAGTILPQASYLPPGQTAADFYQANYGAFGTLYYRLGFHQLYSSWWYLILLGLIGASITIASVDRFFPLYTALKNQRPYRHPQFLQAQPLYSKTEAVTSETIAVLTERLKQKGYQIYKQDEHILAEKQRFARWGPYVNHIGLLFVLLAAFLRLFPFFYQDEFIWVREGETAVVPGTEQTLYIKNNAFTAAAYDKNDERFEEAIAAEGREIPSSFETNLELFTAESVIPGKEPNLTSVLTGAVKVNHPLQAEGFTIYQSGYQLNEFDSLTLTFTDSSGTAYPITVSAEDPEAQYMLGDHTEVTLADYYPDYEMNNGAPRTVSKYPRNPAFLFKAVNDTGPAEKYFVALDANVNGQQNSSYQVRISDYTTHDVSGLSVKRDWTLPLFLAGGIIFLAGVIQGLYFQHRRIWLHIEKGGGLMLAAHTTKNIRSFSGQLAELTAGLHVNPLREKEKRMRE